MKNTSESSRKQGSRENSTGSQAGWYVELQVLCEFGGNSTQLHVLAPPGNAIHRAATSVRSQDTQIWADFACLCFGLVPGSSPSCSHITNMLYLRHLWKYKDHCTAVCECRACSKQQTLSTPKDLLPCGLHAMHSVLGEGESRSLITPA